MVNFEQVEALSLVPWMGFNFRNRLYLCLQHTHLCIGVWMEDLSMGWVNFFKDARCQNLQFLRVYPVTYQKCTNNNIIKDLADL